MKPNLINSCDEITEKTHKHLASCYDLAEKYSIPVDAIMESTMGAFLYQYKASTTATKQQFIEFVSGILARLPEDIKETKQ